jgi:hypothetical protein
LTHPFAAASLRRLLTGLTLSMALLLALCLAGAPAQALSANDFPASPPSSHLIDAGDVFSRASRAEVENQLEALGAERVDARLVTLNRLDYGLTLDQLGQQLLDRWAASSADGVDANQLLLLIDTKTKAAAVLASPQLQRQLPPDLLRSTARSTMAQPLRDGDRYRQRHPPCHRLSSFRLDVHGFACECQAPKHLTIAFQWSGRPADAPGDHGHDQANDSCQEDGVDKCVDYPARPQK